MGRKLSYKQLAKIFCEQMSYESSFAVIDSSTPILVSFHEETFYVYIKNISSAYFDNPDITRAQLPIKKEFEKVKESDFKIVFLGYDSVNEVFVTWNPYYVKQRVNTRGSVSFYSRESQQQEAGKFHTEIYFKDSHGNDVYAVSQEKIPELLSKIFRIFKNEEYVAVGSKARPEANKSFTTFNKSKSVEHFYSHMKKTAVDDDIIISYTAKLMRLIKSNIITKTRTVFLAKDHISEYKDVLKAFFAHDEFKSYSEDVETLEQALIAYIDFLAGYEIENHQGTEEPDLLSTPTEEDYETPYIGRNGKLTKIANPELLTRLSKYLNIKFPTPLPALSVIEAFYGDRFERTMSMKDWIMLFETINWDEVNL